jgi:hypothetical protein
MAIAVHATTQMTRPSMFLCLHPLSWLSNAMFSSKLHVGVQGSRRPMPTRPPASPVPLKPTVIAIQGTGIKPMGGAHVSTAEHHPDDGGCTAASMPHQVIASPEWMASEWLGCPHNRELS